MSKSEIQQKIKQFHEWLVQTEWRGVSSELLEEFQERFLGLLEVAETTQNLHDNGTISLRELVKGLKASRSR